MDILRLAELGYPHHQQDTRGQIVREPDGRTRQYCMDGGVWHKATPAERAHKTDLNFPYTGCPMFVLVETRQGHLVKQWCSQGEATGGINHEGGHH